MDLQECTKFATDNPVCFLATADGSQPHVRTLLMFQANERGFFFAILSPKAVFKQLKRNPLVEVCFFNFAKNSTEWKMMRVTGRAEILDDPELRKRAAQERRGLEAVINQPLEPLVEIVCINKGEAFFWTIQDALKEAGAARVTF